MNPIFTFILDKINKEHLFTLVDVGAMEGIARKWHFLSGFMRVFAFEPDKREFTKLKSNSSVTYFNYVLYSRSQDLEFYITKRPGESSIYKPNMHVLSEFEDTDRFDVVNVEHLPCERIRTLDSFIKEGLITDIDFVKLDTQGSELKILEGSQGYAIPKIFAMEVEAEFIQIYEAQPLFGDVNEFMAKQGFQLIDLRRAYWKRKDYYDYPGKGQLVFADALYFKKIDKVFEELNILRDKAYAKSKIYKIILLCVTYGMFDYAVTIAKESRKLQYIPPPEYEGLLSRIKAYSSRSIIPSFPAKGKLYALINLINNYLFKPKSYLGWADGDGEIGNIKDK